MRKIPTLFQRDYSDPQRPKLTDRVTPGCEWVLAGEGAPTRKYDGTCVMLDNDDRWWARREVKPGKPAPAGFRLEQVDGTTGKQVGWEPIEQSPFAKFHAEALGTRQHIRGTHELIGPKINGNPERRDRHELVPHEAAEIVAMREPTYDKLARVLPEWYREYGIEGIVWHHPDGRMAKIKARDFLRG